MLERIHGGVRYLGRKREFREHKRSNSRIQERVSARHGRRGITRAWRGNIPIGRITRKIYSKETIWVVRQAIWPGVLGKNGEKLETMEGQETCEKRDDENNPRGWRNWRGKIRNMRVNRKGWRQWRGQKGLLAWHELKMQYQVPIVC